MKTTKVNTLTLKEAAYPAVLRSLSSAPPRLYYRGTAPDDWLSRPRVAIVGSRKASAYGLNVTEALSRQLSAQGVVIISGMAYGVDSAAHRAALAAGGLTVAVLGSSLEQIYPAANRQLAGKIAASGCLISEYGPDDAIHPSNFIARNRLISGLADILVITEAAVNSGSLYTAKFALEQGRTVMAVPGNINHPNSAGCNNLIKSGAIPVTEVADIFFALGLKPADQGRRLLRGSPAEERLYRLIKQGVSDQEELALGTGLDGASLNSALTSLELNGHIRPAGGGRWLIG